MSGLRFIVASGTVTSPGEDSTQPVTSDLLVSNTGSGVLEVYFHDVGLGSDSAKVNIPAGESRNIPASVAVLTPKNGWFKLTSPTSTSYEVAYWTYAE